jgi:ADP-dependent NAD(P)H-hydrate dehydratase / NAD(P)H-hydrate epimerase
LASKAALSTGSGLITAFIPKCGYNIIQTAFPEAMVITDQEETLISNIVYTIEPSVIGFGIGIGTLKKTVEAFKRFLGENKKPLVIDADGINILAKNKDLLKLLPKSTVLTPHPKELERLIGKWKDDFDKLTKAKTFTKKYKIVLVIKGAHTITIFEDTLYINSTGNPGLATAGSGDVLTGIITGLIAQGYTPNVASIFGVYLHGKAADIALEDFGYQSLIASHIIEYLGEAYLDLFKDPNQQVQEPVEKEKDEGEDKELYV